MTLNNSEDVAVKKLKLNACVACFGLFEFIDEIVAKVKSSESLQRYEVKRFVSTYSLPVSLDVVQLQLWLALIEKFPAKIDSGEKRRKVKLQRNR